MPRVSTISDPIVRRRIVVTGIVQGVGFRPTVYRIARSLDLTGWVRNDGHGVTVEIQGPESAVDAFPDRLRAGAPGPSSIHDIEVREIDVLEVGAPVIGTPVRVALDPEVRHHLGSREPQVDTDEGFSIDLSDSDLPADTMIAPDIATCPDCLAELMDSGDRRNGYAFLNCTNCGPRYTIVRHLPYDRPSTSMSEFEQCPKCQNEYDDPLDRRFHAQPNACPVCGPRLAIIEDRREVDVVDPVAHAQAALAAGRIVAIRGIGGFHLAVDPTNTEAVAELRRRKRRTDKPFALMARDLEEVKQFAHVSAAEAKLLTEPARPIVLLEPLSQAGPFASGIAPGQSTLGVMLPYAPLHHLLLRGPRATLVMTSANLAEEPIITEADGFDPESAIRLADVVLTHNRDIVQRCDDSVTRVGPKGPFPIRRSRGYVPTPIRLAEPVPVPILAVGGQLKNTIAVARGREVVMSQHIGDLDNPLALGFFEDTVAHLCAILQVEPELVVCDRHPDYLSTKWAKSSGLPVEQVQHHHAHFAGVLAEHDHRDPAIGLILDGTGFGSDGTIWGGELLVGTAGESERLGHLQHMQIPGGERAIQEPWRLGAALLFRLLGEDWIQHPATKVLDRSAEELRLLDRVMSRGVNAPLTSSAGRLFDGVSVLLGVRNAISYEGQAAIELESLARCGSPEVWENVRSNASMFESAIQTDELVKAVLKDLERSVPAKDIAARFHASLAHRLSAIVVHGAAESDIDTCVLSGGVFQNMTLLTQVVRNLEAAGLDVLLPTRLPANDGGLAFGQVAAAAARLHESNRTLNQSRQDIPCV